MGYKVFALPHTRLACKHVYLDHSRMNGLVAGAPDKSYVHADRETDILACMPHATLRVRSVGEAVSHIG
jgi:hypothetical protein